MRKKSISLVENVVLIQSGTCEENGLSAPISVKDCQEKSKAVGIYDKKVLAKERECSNSVCGCRAFSYRSENLNSLQWCNPKRRCSKVATKCTKKSQCVCISKGNGRIHLAWKYYDIL